MKDLSYGKDYKYAHNYENGFTDQEFLPEKASGTAFYKPGENTREQDTLIRLRKMWKKYGY
jgi:putative ATPase